MSSGGWAAGSCPHGVVYALKFVIRGESPRDYVDLIRSLKFPPTVCISDVPHRLAVHANNVVHQMFSPFDGRLFEPTADNIRDAINGSLVKHMPWIGGLNKTPTVADVHPVSGIKERYSLFDRFHENNSGADADILRRVTLVPELNGFINTETEEQLHSKFKDTNYFLNMMSPVNHIFCKRLLIHFSNEAINSNYKSTLLEVLKKQSRENDITEDSLGMFTLSSLVGVHQSDDSGMYVHKFIIQMGVF